MDQKTQKIINAANAALKKSAAALPASQTAARKLSDDIKMIEEENEQAQAKIDEEIEKIVQKTDEATLDFVKATEE